MKREDRSGLIFFFCILTCLSVLAGCHSRPNENTVCYKKECYSVELAISDEEKMRGLQHRDRLAENHGMLFALDGRSPQKFWMKETLIPLDMIWMDYDGRIIYLEHDAVPCEKDPCPVYGPDVPASFVLELNAGEAARLDMRKGERINLDLKKINK